MDETSMNLFRWLNVAVTRNLRTIEMIGVLMRIFSFSLVSWLGPESPFLFVWAFNTADAVMLSWCAFIKKDPGAATPEGFAVYDVKEQSIRSILILFSGIYGPPNDEAVCAAGAVVEWQR